MKIVCIQKFQHNALLSRQPCKDLDQWDSFELKAVTETNRDILLNKGYIHKIPI